jgi:hypothetical protein
MRGVPMGRVIPWAKNRTALFRGRHCEDVLILLCFRLCFRWYYARHLEGMVARDFDDESVTI